MNALRRLGWFFGAGLPWRRARPVPAAKSLGEQVADLATDLGIHLEPWQRAYLDRVFNEKGPR